MNKICRKTVSRLNENLRPAFESNIASLCYLRRLRDGLKLPYSNPIQSEHSLYLKILRLYTDTKAEKQGRLVHSHLVAHGFPLNVHLNTKLIIFYSKVDDMISARKLFNKMPERNVVSWTALLSGYSQNGDYKEALMVFLAMHRAGVKANQFTYGSVLRACTSFMCLDTGKQIQGCMQKGRFVKNLFVQSALVDFHSKCGKMEDACYVFELMTDRDVVSWNAMIGGYTVQGFGNDAFIMFHSMLREGMVPDCFTLGSVLKASIGDSGFMKISQLHGFIIQLGLELHNILTGTLIDAYVKCGSVRSADHVYKSMQKKDTVSCTALIMGYAQEGKNSCDALDLFNEVHQMPKGIDDVILCSMLNICANTTSLGLGRQIHAIALKYQPNNDIAMGNALIDMYSKSGEINDANHVFDEMEETNVISWTSLIAGYGMHGYGQNAISLYKKMEYEGLKPNNITFLSLLFACSHNGLTAEGWDCFNDMVRLRRYNISPRAEHYACMVDLFACGGQLEEAYNMICKMDIRPNVPLWSAILGACSIYGDILLGELAARHLLNIEPENSINYVVLANIYAAAGSWDIAWMMRKVLEERSLRKYPGCSSFESTHKSIALLPAG